MSLVDHRHFCLGVSHREMAPRDNAMLRSAFLGRYQAQIAVHSEVCPETFTTHALNRAYVWMATRPDGEPFSPEQEAYLAGYMTAVRLLEANPVGELKEGQKECE